jgi:hypothetical protein
MDANITPDQTQKPTVVTGGNGEPRKKRGRIVIIAVLILALLSIGGFFLFRQLTIGSQVNENSETVVDVSSQVNEANEYPVGSYMWANLMLNAAMYASSNGACGQASNIITNVENTKLEEEVDIAAARQDVQENCK